MRPRVAYLILSYTGPVERLVATLRAGSPDALIAVHHDDRRTTLGAVDALRIDPRPVEWGHGSQLAAVLRCLRWVRERAAFDWLVLLSGQDYPLRPVGEIEASLHGADAFIQTAPVAPLAWRRGEADEFARRYRMRWRPVLGGGRARGRQGRPARPRAAAAVGHVPGPARGAAAARVPRLGLVHALAPRRRHRARGAGRGRRPLPAHDRPHRGLRADRAGELAAAALGRQPPLRALRARLAQPARPHRRRPRRGAGLRRRLRRAKFERLAGAVLRGELARPREARS